MLESYGVFPYSVVFPRINAIEILFPPEQRPGMKKFLDDTEQTPVKNADPFLQWRTNTDKSLIRFMVKALSNRLNMLRLERESIGFQYLKQTVLQGIELLEEKKAFYQARKIRTELDEVLLRRRVFDLPHGISVLLWDHESVIN